MNIIYYLTHCRFILKSDNQEENKNNEENEENEDLNKEKEITIEDLALEAKFIQHEDPTTLFKQLNSKHQGYVFG